MVLEHEDAVRQQRFWQWLSDNPTTVLAVIGSAVLAISHNPPGRLDLWVAEFAGTALVISVIPFCIRRRFGAYSVPVTVASVALAAFAIASGPTEDGAQENTAPYRSHAASAEPLPTASDGFGAYARDSSQSL